MKGLLALILFGFVAWYGYGRYEQAKSNPPSAAVPQNRPTPQSLFKADSSSSFKCDGRTRCGQMSSCEEATYFVQNCPNTQMDGNNDGVPCEQQWCN